MKKFILILLTWVSCTPIEFHLQNQTQIPLKNPKSISAISDDKIVFTNYYRNVYLVSGTNFSNTTYMYSQIGNSRTLFIGDKRYQSFNDQQVDEIEYQRNYIGYSISDYQITQSEGAILLDNFALFSYNYTCAQIIKMDLKIGQYDTIIFQQQNCTFAKAGNFTHLQQDHIVVWTSGDRIFVLDDQTLEVKQKMNAKDSLGFSMNIKFINSIFDKARNVSLVQFGNGTFYLKYKYDPLSQQLKKVSQFYDRTYFNQMIDSTRAVSFRFLQDTTTYICYWQDYDHITLALNFNDQNQAMYSKRLFALSNKEDIFAALSSKSGLTRNLSVYSMDNNYKIDKLKNITYNESFQQASDLKASFNSEDTHVFVMSTLQNYSNLIKIDIASQNFTTIVGNDTQGELIVDFSLFDQSTDRFLLLMKKQNFYNQTQLYVQIRKISDLSIVSESKVNFNDSQLYSNRLNLYRTQKWSTYFIIQSINSNFSNVFLFNFQNDSIIYTGTSLNVSMTSIKTHVCSQFIIFMSYKVLYVYNYKQLINPKVIQFDLAYYVEYSQKDHLIIESKISYNYQGIYDKSGTIICDFSKEEAQWCQGMIYKQYQNLAYSKTPYSSILFSKRKLFYYFRPDYFAAYEELPYKVVYNISNPIIKFTSRQVPSRFTSIDIDSYKYVQDPQNNPIKQNISCGFVFFIEAQTPPILRKIDTCTYIEESYQILSVPYGFKIIYSKIDKTRTGKHIIISFRGLFSSFTYYYYVEVRSLDNPNRIVYSNRFDSNSIGKQWPIMDFDSNNYSLFYSQYKGQIFYQQYSKKQYCISYQISSITSFYVKGKYLAIAGQDITNSSYSNVVFKQFQSNFVTFKRNIIGLVVNLTFDENGSYIAAYTNDGTLFVWNISNYAILYQNQHKNVNSLYLTANNTITLKYSKSFQIINFISNIPKISERNIQIGAGYYYDVAISPTGELIAHIAQNNKVSIFTNDGSFVMNFTAPIPAGVALIALSFSPNNTLMAITQNSTLFILNPSGCPDTYFNFDGICGCSQNSTLSDQSLCQCKTNFNPDIGNRTCSCNSKNYAFDEQTDSCFCPSSFELSNTDCLCINGYIEGETCNKCSFLCSDGCMGPFLNCNSFSTYFYIIIGGIVVFSVLITIILVYRIRKNKERIKYDSSSNLTKNLTTQNEQFDKPLRLDYS